MRTVSNTRSLWNCCSPVCPLSASPFCSAIRVRGSQRREGFWLSEWMRKRSVLSQLRVARRVQGLLGSDLKTEIHARYRLEDALQGLNQYAAGKTLLMPSRTETPT